MKITLLTPALAAILGLALAGMPMTTQAQTPTPTPSTAAKPKKIEYKGKLTAIDTTANTITEGDKTLSITADTKILKDKKPATLADFVVGETVTGSYIKDSTGKMVAASLHTKTVAPTPTPAAKATN